MPESTFPDIELADVSRSIVPPSDSRKIREINGYTLYQGSNGFDLAAVVDLQAGSKIIPIFAPSHEQNGNVWMVTLPLTPFFNRPDVKAIFTGSFFGIEIGTNARVRNGQIAETIINYPQKLDGNILFGWAPDGNYQGFWRSLAIAGGKADVVVIPGEDQRTRAESVVTDSAYEIVITGLSPDAGKAKKTACVRTMLMVGDGGNKVLVYAGYGTQRKVTDAVLGFGGDYGAIVMMDGGSSSTIGYKNASGNIVTLVDPEQRNIPMALGIVP